MIGAGPAGLACAGELAALGYAVTVYDERDEPGGLVRYAIAPYRIVSDPLPGGGARTRATSASSFELGDADRLRPSLQRDRDRRATRSSSASGWARTPTSPFPGDDLPGVWESLPFIEAVKTGHPLRRRPAASS